MLSLGIEQLPRSTIANDLVLSPPSDQQALDIFKGEWVVGMPKETGLIAGAFPGDYFNDARILAAEKMLGGFSGRTVLELGPYEAHHTTMMAKRGASLVTAIEANTRAYLKCLIVKEIMGLTNARFWLGNAAEFLRTTDQRFDILIASGFLYHQAEPDIVLSHMTKVSDRLFVQTHYYDETLIASSRMAGRFKKTFSRIGGPVYYRMPYTDQDSPIYLGGPASYTNWISREAIFRPLEKRGYEIQIAFEELDHPNGPSIAFAAQR